MGQSSRKRLFGFRFTTASMQDLVEAISGTAADGVRTVVTANIDHVVNLRRNGAFRQAYDGAWVVTADGFPVWAYARFVRRLALNHVTGADLINTLLNEALSPDRHRLFFVVPSEESAAGVRRIMAGRGFAPGQIAAVVPPFGFEDDPVLSKDLADRVRAHGTTHLVMAVGAPKSEVWVNVWQGRLGSCYALCVGAGLDYATGMLVRAPRLLRRVGLEWAWRLGNEPTRLWRRYLVNSWPFFAALVDDLKASMPNWRTGRA